ncbi:MAG: hypothetical protein AB1563_02040 [Bacillota bacterium]
MNNGHGNVVSLTISSTVAGELTATFALAQPLAAVKKEALARLKLDPSKADAYVLLWNGTRLNESATVAEAGLPDGAVLLLEPVQPEVI